DAFWFWDESEKTAAGTALLYKGLPPAGAIDAGFLSSAGFAGGLARAAQEAVRAKGAGARVIFFSHNTGESERLAELLDEQIGSRGTEGMEFAVGPLRNGFAASSPSLLVLTNAEIFGRYRHRPRLPKFKG